MGEQAFAFVDFLCEAGQKYWQILPVTPTGFGDSPYQSCSAFAGNHYLIDLPTLVKEGLLDLRDESGFPGMKVLEFAFDSREPSEYLPHTYPQNSVCYTGTHDNMTMRQWFETASEDAVAYATEYMGLSEQEGMVWGVCAQQCPVFRICA